MEADRAESGVEPGWRSAVPGWSEARFPVVAALVWCGALIGRDWWGFGTVLVLGAVVVIVKRGGMIIVMAAALVAGALAGWGSAHRDTAVLSAPVVEGDVAIRAVARTDPRKDADSFWLLARPLAYRASGDQDWIEWLGPVIKMETPDAGELAAGEVFEASGHLAKPGGRWSTSVYAARMWSGPVVPVHGARGWLVGTGNALRRRVIENLRSGPGDGRALVAGFLVGDTSGLSPTYTAHLRRAGLSHFVAVSGGNVALFLGALWILMWPLAGRPMIRALVGFVALGVFMVVTRWEPSVVRAGLLAALVLGAQGMGFPLSSWAALGGAVTVALLVSGELALSVGFALSVAATLGVMVGMRIPVRRRPRWIWQTLLTAIAAQVTVAPILLWVFGSVPLLSPVANLAAGPLVAVSTSLGGIGTLTGWQPLVWLAAWTAEGVLAVAGFLSPLPQLGWFGAGAALMVGCAARRWPVVGLPMLAVGGGWLVVLSMFPGLVPFVGSESVRAPAVVFLDVGQGDSTLVLGTGVTVLIDGGPDPARLVEKLQKYRVREVHLVVITHPHADHVRGLEGVVGALPVGAVWDASHPHETPAHRMLRERIAEEGISVYRPVPGQGLRIAELGVEVLGPLRRYKHINDQSIVLMLDVAGTTFLLAADIQEVAQAELGAVRPDVLKVPHQGAATSDPSWLKENAGRLAIISVGPNDYGHPVRWVEEVLVEGGARVVRTDQHGDVVVNLPIGDGANG
ncbi:MAG: ComEC/Rec2 family competence protein [bacterium]|nr:ComEC/Rec2 family competence protein [Acidimicrobiia bacterium]MCY4650202.1 ComEC/Rec2 family competence protein [bacterium]